MERKLYDISYHADFKIFRDGEFSINNNNLNFIITEETENKGRLIIKNESEEIETSIKIPISDLNLLIEELKSISNI